MVMSTRSLDITPDYNGAYDVRRDGKLVAELVWCQNPTDWTRFGWLLHIIGASEDEVTAVFRVGEQEPQEALWARRAPDYRWRVDAEATRDTTKASALQETRLTLNGAQDQA